MKAVKEVCAKQGNLNSASQQTGIPVSSQGVILLPLDKQCSSSVINDITYLDITRCFEQGTLGKKYFSD